MTTTILSPYNEKEELSQLLFLTKKMKLSPSFSISQNETVETPFSKHQDVYERLQFIFPSLSKEEITRNIPMQNPTIEKGIEKIKQFLQQKNKVHIKSKNKKRNYIESKMSLTSTYNSSLNVDSIINEMMNIKQVDQMREYLSKMLYPQKEKIVLSSQINQLNALNIKYAKDNLDLSKTLRVVLNETNKAQQVNKQREMECKEKQMQVEHLGMEIQKEQAQSDLYKGILEHLE